MVGSSASDGVAGVLSAGFAGGGGIAASTLGGAGGRDDRGKAGGTAAEPALERIARGCVDQGDLDTGAAAVDLAQHRFKAETVASNVRLGPYLRIDRDHVALAARLHAETREEN